VVQRRDADARAHEANARPEALRGARDPRHAVLRRLRGGHFDRARRFAERLAREPDLEIAIPPQCKIACFRHRPEGATDLDALQSALRRRLIEDGSFYRVQTRLPTGIFLRITIINPATSDTDLDALVDRLREAAQSR
jgi:L-2,4-diaminobutyrate decarboxylase